MIDIEDGMSQSRISQISGFGFATISRCVAKNFYKPIKSVRNQQIFSMEDTRNIFQQIIPKRTVNKSKIVFYNFKGGVGKTSICYQVGAQLSIMGYNVLMIDADPQANLSTSCGFDTDEDYYTLSDMLVNDLSLDQVKHTVFEGLDCIPSNISLTRLEPKLYHLPDNYKQLSKLFVEIEKTYDFILVDTNPNNSIVNRNILYFADAINVVCETQPYSLKSLSVVFEDLDDLYSEAEIAPKIVNIIPNKHDSRTFHAMEVISALNEYYNEYMHPNCVVRKSEDFNHAARLGKPLALFAKKNSIALEDICNLTKHLLEQYTILKVNQMAG